MIIVIHGDEKNLKQTVFKQNLAIKSKGMKMFHQLMLSNVSCDLWGQIPLSF